MAYIDNFQDFIQYHANAAGMTREEYMAVLMSEAKAYNKLYKESKHVKSMNEMAMGYDGHTGLFYIKGVPFTEERLEQVLKHLRTKVKLGDLPKQFSYFPAIQVADEVGGEIVTITLDKAKEIEATLKRFKGKLAHDGDFNESVTEKREDVGKFNTVKKVIKELGRRPSEQELATFITKNYYDVTEVERGEDDPAANDKIADLVAFYKFDIDDWSIAWVDAQNESVVNEADDKEQKSTDRGPLDDDKINTALKTKAEESGVPIGIIRAVMRRGLAAWKSGHRPGANQQQWGYARVNAFLTKGEGTWGNADKDLAKEVRDGGHDKKLKKA